jgi:hypothetical protein
MRVVPKSSENVLIRKKKEDREGNVKMETEIAMLFLQVKQCQGFH